MLIYKVFWIHLLSLENQKLSICIINWKALFSFSWIQIRSPSTNSQKEELQIKGPPNDHTKTEATQKGYLNEVHKDHLKIGASLAGVEQMQIDGSVSIF